jgi:hypothetical protein
MKKAKITKMDQEESLPFSFLKKDFDEEKIKAHWQGIEEKIKTPPVRLKEKKENNNLS